MAMTSKLPGGEKLSSQSSLLEMKDNPCYVQLKILKNKKREEHHIELLARCSPTADMHPKLPGAWRPKGILVAHLHEHRGGVTKLINIPDSSLFASSSTDGCVRLWDCAGMEGRNIANKSRHIYNRLEGPINALTACHHHQCLAAASESGMIHVFKMENNSNKVTFLDKRQLDLTEEGCVVDMQYYDSGAQSVLVYATTYGALVGWDLRSPLHAWKLENDLNYGMIVSMCIDSQQNWMTVGTSNGALVSWDLRFQLPVTDIKSTTKTRIRKIVRFPSAQPVIVSASQGNNEVSAWNLENKSRQTTLWASSVPPLTESRPSVHSVCAMCIGTAGNKPFLITGGNDTRLRFWDFSELENSYMLVPSASDAHVPSVWTYKHKMIQGINVVQEFQSPKPPETGQETEEGRKQSPELPPPGHQDSISDITICHASQYFVVSGSRDGVIKVWK